MLAGVTLNERVTAIVGRILVERSIQRQAGPDDNLREVGLTSLDMVNLVLSIELEFDVQIAENEITPANFQSISAISRLLAKTLSQK